LKELLISARDHVPDHVAPEVEPQPSLHVSVHTSVLNRRNVNEMNVG
jgi:hypothetical protein